MKPKLIVFASGTREGGGSGFENLVLSMDSGVLKANIVAVASNHEYGGVRTRADKLDIPFIHFPAPWDAKGYRRIVDEMYGAEFIALSGWLKRVLGLDPRRTFNIHPGPLPRFGGRGMHGHNVHVAVMDTFLRGEITHSAVCMHFVTAEYDQGPVFFRYNVEIYEDDSPSSLGARVNQCEHLWQPRITNLVVNRQIGWDGVNPESLTVPEGYRIVHEEESK